MITLRSNKLSAYLAPLLLIPLASMFSSCAAPAFNLDGVNRAIQPQQTLTDLHSLNQRVLWGGLIVATRNFKDSSQIEILSYPLNADGEPIRNGQVQGRFLLNQTGFIEPTHYSAGRWISAIGRVQVSQKGQIGEARYQYPVLQAEKSHLWPEPGESNTQTRFSFGIGISL